MRAAPVTRRRGTERRANQHAEEEAASDADQAVVREARDALVGLTRGFSNGSMM